MANQYYANFPSMSINVLSRKTVQLKYFVDIFSSQLDKYAITYDVSNGVVVRFLYHVF